MRCEEIEVCVYAGCIFICHYLNIFRYVKSIISDAEGSVTDILRFGIRHIFGGKFQTRAVRSLFTQMFRFDDFW